MKYVLPIQLVFLILAIHSGCGKAPVPVRGDLYLESASPADSIDAGLVSSTAKQRFYFGVNGHPVTQDAYKGLSAREQIYLIKSLGMNIYRIDVTVDENGRIKMHDRYLEFKRAANSAGVVLLPMLYHPGLNFDFTEEMSYQRGFERGKQFAQLYKDDFVYYNLANELDNMCIIPKHSGASPDHYDPIKFKVVAINIYLCLSSMALTLISLDKYRKIIY